MHTSAVFVFATMNSDLSMALLSMYSCNKLGHDYIQGAQHRQMQ